MVYNVDHTLGMQMVSHTIQLPTAQRIYHKIDAINKKL